MVSDRTMGPLILVETYSVPNLTRNLLTTTIVAPPSNASKWQMGFNSAFKGLTSCNGTSWVNMVFFADQYVLFYELFLFRKRKANWIGHILRRNCLLKHYDHQVKKNPKITRLVNYQFIL